MFERVFGLESLSQLPRLDDLAGDVDELRDGSMPSPSSAARRELWGQTPAFGRRQTLQSSGLTPKGSDPSLWFTVAECASVPALIAAIVAVAFADSSIVVLGLPQLYTQFQTSITGVSWIVTSYNAAVAVTALVLVFFVHRFRARVVFGAGLLLFLAATIACASAQALWFLIAAPVRAGRGRGLLLAGALSLSRVDVWTLAGTFGARSARRSAASSRSCSTGARSSSRRRRSRRAGSSPRARRRTSRRARRAGGRAARTVPANVCLGLVFGALVGALFLGVLLVIIVWQYTPIEGALIVSVLPLARVRGARAAAQAGARRGAARRRARRARLAAVGERPDRDVRAGALRRRARHRRPAALERRARRRGRADAQRHADDRRPPPRLVAAIATIAPLLASTLPAPATARC
jgi:MFS family permease